MYKKKNPMKRYQQKVLEHATLIDRAAVYSRIIALAEMVKDVEIAKLGGDAEASLVDQIAQVIDEASLIKRESLN